MLALCLAGTQVSAHVGRLTPAFGIPTQEGRFTPSYGIPSQEGRDTTFARWSVGLRAGAASTTISRPQAGRVDVVYQSGRGFDVAAVGRYAVTPWLAVRADAGVMQRCHRMQRQLNYLRLVYTDHLSTYAYLPVMADFSFGGERLRGHLLLGGFAGYWVAQRLRGVTYTMTDYEVFFSDFDAQPDFADYQRRFDAGVMGGVEVSYRLGSAWSVSLDALYYYDLVSHHRGYPALRDYRYLNTLSLSVGVAYQFPNTRQQ